MKFLGRKVPKTQRRYVAPTLFSSPSPTLALVMPFYLDSHERSASNYDAFPNSKEKEVHLIRIMNVHGDNTDYCITNAPNRESVEAFHLEQGIKCSWIEEVNSIEEFHIDNEALFFMPLEANS